jgi:hypothetical protein
MGQNVLLTAGLCQICPTMVACLPGSSPSYASLRFKADERHCRPLLRQIIEQTRPGLRNVRSKHPLTAQMPSVWY